MHFFFFSTAGESFIMSEHIFGISWHFYPDWFMMSLTVE